MLLLPGGRVKSKEEGYQKAARRETKEETGIDAEVNDTLLFAGLENAPFMRRYDDVIDIMDKTGKVWVYPRDLKTGYGFTGYVLGMWPIDDSEPRDMGTDLKNPRYVPINWLIEHQEKLMPEEQMLIDLLIQKRYGKITGDITLLEEEDFSDFFKEIHV